MNQQPEALILANDRPSAIGDDLYQWALDAEGMIRRLNARVEELEAMLDAVGAGGVSAQRVTQAKDHIEQPLEMVAAPVVLPEPEAHLFQHEDTGQTIFVDAQQVEWGFEAHNPRLHKVSCVYTEQQVRELLADARDAERWSEIGKSIERACGELPEDFEINIHLENGAGTTSLLYPSGEECENFPHDDGFAGVVNAAIEAAIAAAKGAQK